MSPDVRGLLLQRIYELLDVHDVPVRLGRYVWARYDAPIPVTPVLGTVQLAREGAV